MNRLQTICLPILLILTIITLSCENRVEKVKIGYQKTEIYQHMFVAMDKELFKNEGIEVEPIEFASANLMAEALVGGRIDATATSAFPVIFSIEQNNPEQFKVYIVNVINKTAFPDYILIKKDSKMNSLSELKGKKIGTYPGSTILTYTKIILGHFMNPEKDITIVQLKPALQLHALETGQVDAIFCLEPIASVGIIRSIARVLEEAPLAKYVMEPLPGSASTFSPNFVKNRPEAAEKVKRAMYSALDFLGNYNNIQEARKILAKWTDMEPEVIERLQPLRYWKLEDIDRQAIQKLADLLFERGALEKKVDTSNLYYKQ